MSSAGRRLRIAPSLLSADFGAIGDAVAAAEAGGADAFHLDVMDGHFVPNISFGPSMVAAVRARTKLPLDVHLMIDRPDTYAEAFVRAGGDTLVFHWESRADPREVVRRVRALGAAVGISVKPETPFEAVTPLLPSVDQVMVMSVHPGFSGQSFLPGAIPKLRAARAAIDTLGTPIDLSIDGGVTTDTAGPAASAGASFFVCGNAVFNAQPIADNLRRVRSAIQGGVEHAVR